MSDYAGLFIMLSFLAFFIIIAIGVLALIWENRGTPEQQEMRRMVKELKQSQKEVDKLRKELFDD